MKTIKILLFLLTALALTACKQVSITAPTNNFVDDEMPASFAITFAGGAPADLAIRINNTVVTDRFIVSDTGANATASELADTIFPGRNVFRVVGNKQVKQVYFYYDQEGPSIRITDTDHVSNVVSGYVVDKGGVASVTLDGADVPLDSKNAFSVPFTKQDVNTFVATDNFGHISETQFANRDTQFTGISARLNQGGLDFLTSALETELKRANFQKIISGIKPFKLLDLDFFFVPIFELNLKVTDLSLGDIDIDLNVQDDERIATYLNTKNFKLGLQFSGHISLLPYNSRVTANINNLDVWTNLLLDIRNADLDLAVSGTRVQNSTVWLDFQYIPSFIDKITSLTVSWIVELMKPLFIDILQQIIIPIASDFIKDIPINLHLVTLDDGEKLNIRALPQFLDTNNRGISVDLATKIWAPEPAAGVAGALGSLYVPGDTPTLSHIDPDGVPFDFGASINANVINQAFLAAHEAGVTTMAVHPETYANATPEGIQVYAAGADFGEGAKIGMRIEPVSAPYIKLMPSDDGAPGKFGWSDVHLAFDLYRPEWGEYRQLFGVTFDLEVPFDINTTDDGYLSIGIEQLPTIFIGKTDTNSMLLIPASFINGTLDYFMPAVLPRLAAKLKAVPLPRIYNHTLHMNKFWIAGEGNNSLALTGDLIPLAATEAAPRPSTTVDYTTSNIVVQQESVADNGTVTSSAVSVRNGEVRIDVYGTNPSQSFGLLEHRYRVDGGPWTNWKHRDTIRLSRLLAGEHSVEICARTALLKREQGCPVVHFTTSVN